MIKECCKCGEQKDHYEDGMNNSVCKDCRRAHRRESYTSVRTRALLTPVEKKARWAAYYRDYRKKNREVLREKARARYTNQTPDQRKLKQKRGRKRDKLLYAEEYENITALRDFVNYHPLHDCAICQKSITPIEVQIDHILPLCKGGTNAKENLQIVCSVCNKKKGTKISFS